MDPNPASMTTSAHWPWLLPRLEEMLTFALVAEAHVAGMIRVLRDDLRWLGDDVTHAERAEVERLMRGIAWVSEDPQGDRFRRLYYKVADLCRPNRWAPFTGRELLTALTERVWFASYWAPEPATALPAAA